MAAKKAACSAELDKLLLFMLLCSRVFFSFRKLWDISQSTSIGVFIFLLISIRCKLNEWTRSFTKRIKYFGKIASLQLSFDFWRAHCQAAQNNFICSIIRRSNSSGFFFLLTPNDQTRTHTLHFSRNCRICQPEPKIVGREDCYCVSSPSLLLLLCFCIVYYLCWRWVSCCFVERLTQQQQHIKRQEFMRIELPLLRASVSFVIVSVYACSSIAHSSLVHTYLHPLFLCIEKCLYCMYTRHIVYAAVYALPLSVSPSILVFLFKF